MNATNRDLPLLTDAADGLYITPTSLASKRHEVDIINAQGRREGDWVMVRVWVKVSVRVRGDSVWSVLRG